MISRAVPFLPRKIPPPCRCSLTRTQTSFSRSPRWFHSSPRRHDATSLPDHYATLNLPALATPATVKKQFYALSKANHPDLHPNDPEASQRFLRISEAYATLGSADKRARYDRDFLRSNQRSSRSTSYPSGSFSSASASSPGGRPASGLSRRRTQFRGPPPSFYRAGGWGEHANKREEHARKASHPHEAQVNAESGPNSSYGPSSPGNASSSSSYSKYDYPGTSPSGFASGYSSDIPHFDRDGHFRTHSGIEQNRHKTRRKQPGTTISEEELEASRGNSAVFNFLMMSGVLAAIWGISTVLMSNNSVSRRVKGNGDDRNGNGAGK